MSSLLQDEQSPMDTTSRTMQENRKAREERAEKRIQREEYRKVWVAKFKQEWERTHRGEDYGNILAEWGSYQGTLTLEEFIKMRTNEALLKKFLANL